MRSYINNFILFFIVPAILLLILFSNISSIDRTDNNIYKTYSELSKGYYNKLEMYEGVTVKQYFTCKTDSISSLICFATINISRISTQGEWTFELYDEENKKLLTSKVVEIAGLSLYSNSRTAIKIPTQKNLKGKLLSLKISSDSLRGSSASLLAMNAPGDIESESLILKRFEKNDKPFNAKMYFNIEHDISRGVLLSYEIYLLAFFNLFYLLAHILKKIFNFSMPKKCVSYIKSSYLIIALFLVGATISRLLWSHISLPFSNPLEAIGPLALKGINPNNYLLNYIIYVSLPSIFFLIIYALAPKLRDTLLFNVELSDTGATKATQEKIISDENLLGLLKTASLTILILWGVTSALKFFMLPFTPTPLDIFHEGEFLTPAYNYITSSGLWKSSFFIHGAFYNPLTTVLGWKIFATESIGASRVMIYAIENINFLAVALFFLSIVYASTREDESVDKITLLQLMLLVFVSTHLTHQFFDKRDLPILIGMSFFLVGVKRESLILSFIAGTFSAISYFYAIDRGAYYTLTIILVLPITFYFYYDRNKFKKIIIASSVGIIFGWLAFYISFGHEEFIAFLYNAKMVYKTIPLIAFWEIPTPDFSSFERYRVIPLVLIAIQILGAVIFIVKKYLKRTDIHLVTAHSSIVLLSFFYFRSGLGRAEILHVKYASSFAFIGVAYLSWLVIRNLRRPLLIRSLLFLLIGINTTLVVSNISKLSFSTISSAPERITRFVSEPDYMFLDKDARETVEMLKATFKDEPCFLSFTNEAALPYLLKKPSCGEFFIVWFATPKPQREKLIEDIKEHAPKYILFRSPTFYNTFDNIKNEVRFPEVNDFVLRNYTPYKNIAGYEIYIKHNGVLN
ncbi:hypothetical protein ACFL2A_02185 [Thermodesulfobacteriota bacterium]